LKLVGLGSGAGDLAVTDDLVKSESGVVPPQSKSSWEFAPNPAPRGDGYFWMFAGPKPDGLL
jgi:hypothetical protein